MSSRFRVNGNDMDRNDFFTNPKGRIQMKKWIPQLAALTLAVGAVAADPLPADLKIDEKGAFKINSVQFFLQHFGPE